ncbi:MAG TPA: DUF2167 domain-containing protein [Trichormus sp.]|jgi:uncharacterized membrane-anchored protein
MKMLRKNAVRTAFTLMAVCGALAIGGGSALADDKMAGKAMAGPCKVPLEKNLATINLPDGYIFIEKDYARKLLEQQGDKDDSISGIIVPVTKDGKEGDFEVYCSYNECGYVKDDDAGKLNPDEILQSYKDGTESQNEDRKAVNLPPIYVGGWAEKPRYDKAKHQLVWAIQVKDQDSATAPVSTVNYNTRILGRHGALSLNLVTAPDRLDANKSKVATLLNDTTFNSGQTYTDYVPGKDKAAEFGIAGLILGGGALAAAAKFGLFGVLGKYLIGILLVMKKFIFIAIAGAGAFFAKIFKKKPKATATSPMDQPPPQ